MRTDGLLKWVEIDRASLRANLRWVKSLLAPRVRLMAVVKADAYGYGAVPISRLVASEGVDCLGTLTVEEAALLRQNGVKNRIVVLSPPLPKTAALAVRTQAELTIDSLDLARALSKTARRAVSVHVDLDYGLGRWGIAARELPQFLDYIRRLPHLRLAGLSAHLDYVSGKNAVEAEEKLHDFNRLAARLKAACPGLICHGANSSILLDFPHWQMDMVRVGNLIYGINPTSKETPLRDPWSLKARIIALKEVAKGRSIGYASEYVAARRMNVATVPVGYADGLTMEPAERFIRVGQGLQYWGILGGRVAPFVGRCGITHALLDVTSIPKVRVGDVVSLPIRRTAASTRLPRLYQ